MRDAFDTAVIGGGLGGLAAAAYVARTGRKVALFERATALGGRARTKTHRGFCLNVGAHALYRGGAAWRVLAELGVSFGGAGPALSHAGALLRGSLRRLPQGLWSLFTSDLLPLSAKFQAARAFQRLRGVEHEDVAGLSLAAWLDGEALTPEVRALVLAIFRLSTYANAPDLIDAGAAIAQLQHAAKHGVVYVDGGWETLVTGLAESAARAGVVIVRGAKIARVARAGRGVAGVELEDGTRYGAASVVLASSPQVAASLAASPALTAFAERAIPARAACLDVALARLPDARRLFALGIDAPLYFSVHSGAARLAPAGGALVHAAKYLAPGAKGDGDDEAELEELLDAMQPGWRDAVVARQYLPGMTVAHAIPSRSPFASSVPDVDGLFVVGDWVGGHGMLADAVLGSACEAATVIASAAGGTGARVIAS